MESDWTKLFFLAQYHILDDDQLLQSISKCNDFPVCMFLCESVAGYVLAHGYVFINGFRAAVEGTNNKNTLTKTCTIDTIWTKTDGQFLQ